MEIGPLGGSVHWASASVPAAGETKSGDRAVVFANRSGALIAVVDALGHGREASEVADIAVAAIEANAEDELPSVLLLCHRELRGSRGAVVALARFEAADTLSWIAVGNVKTLIMRAQFGRTQAFATATAHAGVLGMHMPPTRSGGLVLRSGDVLVMASDGVIDVEMETGPWSSLGDAAARIVECNRVPADDAILIAARLSPGPAR